MDDRRERPVICDRKKAAICSRAVCPIVLEQAGAALLHETVFVS